MVDLTPYMRLAIDEARISLREGNCGFGAVIVKDGRLVATARDAEKTAADPTAHAEITAIRIAAAKLGRDLSGAVLVATHEPCPMCTTAMLWSGITDIAYGCSIKQAIELGRRRIDLPCREIYDRAGRKLLIHPDVLKHECELLYNPAVRDHVDQLRNADQSKLEALARELSAKRLQWFAGQRRPICSDSTDVIKCAYEVFLKKLGIESSEAPVAHRDENSLVLHSVNFCPTLEACKILDMDTRFVCRNFTEKPTTELLRQIHPGLRFTRNYEMLRPHAPYCEEIITLD
jgi:tRNA(Arg) A34 adenosine deaminase TadA